MDTRNGLVNFMLFIFLFAFSFIYSLHALSLPNVFYGVLAIIGFIVCLGGSLFNGVLAQRDGEALALWFFTFAGTCAIITVWYLTRCGTAFGWW
jgi:hypothetical protein